MPTITLDATGVPKSVLVEGAYEFCGLSAQEYERTPEEMNLGLRRLNAVMGLLSDKGLDLGYVFPDYGDGLLEEPCGLPTGAVEPVTALLAQRIAPSLGASLSDDAKAVLATSVPALYANYAKAPCHMKPAHKLWSAGVRHGRFVTVLPDDDCDQ